MSSRSSSLIKSLGFPNSLSFGQNIAFWLGLVVCMQCYYTFLMVQHLSTKIEKNFFNLCSHRDDFGVSAEWHFSATSHGKGACDGLGGTVK